MPAPAETSKTSWPTARSIGNPSPRGRRAWCRREHYAQGVGSQSRAEQEAEQTRARVDQMKCPSPPVSVATSWQYCRPRALTRERHRVRAPRSSRLVLGSRGQACEIAAASRLITWFDSSAGDNITSSADCGTSRMPFNSSSRARRHGRGPGAVSRTSLSASSAFPCRQRFATGSPADASAA